MGWSVTFYSERVETDIAKMPAGLVARFIRYAERMETFGPDLGMPHWIVVLHSFIKKTAKTPAKELLLARSRMKEV